MNYEHYRKDLQRRLNELKQEIKETEEELEHLLDIKPEDFNFAIEAYIKHQKILESSYSESSDNDDKLERLIKLRKVIRDVTANDQIK